MIVSRTDHVLLDDYRCEVEGMIDAHEPFGEVEERIDDAVLSDDEKAALWLFAWSLREPRIQRQDAAATLALVTG
jgi:hypothetical protein